MSKLGALSAFVAITEHGSFSKAAALLGKTPSALTKIIANLETELGTRLLERTTRRLALTEAGKIYLKHARQAMLQLQQACEEIDQLHDEVRGNLRLSAPPSFGPAFLNDACSRFLRTYPQVQLEVNLTDEFVDLIDGGYDLAVRDGPIDLPGLIAKPVAPNRVLLCASPAYLARNPLEVLPQTFDQHAWLTFRHPALNPHYWWLTYNGERQRILQPTPHLASDSYDLLFACLLKGHGLQFCPQWSAAPYLARGELVQLLPGIDLNPGDLGRQVHAIYPTHRRYTRKVQAFIECLTDCLDEQQLH